MTLVTSPLTLRDDATSDVGGSYGGFHMAARIHIAPQGDQGLIDADGAAAYLHVSPRTVRKWAQVGKLPSVKLGRSLRFSPAALRTWVDSNARHAEQ